MEMARIDTKMTETRFVCDFVVRNFEQLLASHPVGRSMSVPFCTYDMFKADFHVYPNGVEGDPGFLVTGIVRTDDIPKPVTASFGVKLLHPRMISSVYCCKDFKERRWDPETEAEDMRVESRHVSVDAIRNHYLDETGSITLRVEFILKKNTFGDERMQRQITLLPDDRQRMNTDYVNEVGGLLQSHTFADVVLIAQGTEFKAHRNILCARSSAFKSMLLGNMSESSSGCIEISDAAPETLASFLEFLYTGSCKVNAGGSAGSTSLEKIVCASRIPPRPLEALRLKAGSWKLSERCCHLRRALGTSRWPWALSGGSWHFQMAFDTSREILALPKGPLYFQRVYSTSKRSPFFFQRAHSISKGPILFPKGAHSTSKRGPYYFQRAHTISNVPILLPKGPFYFQKGPILLPEGPFYFQVAFATSSR